jgi:hypothetical protein
VDRSADLSRDRFRMAAGNAITERVPTPPRHAQPGLTAPRRGQCGLSAPLADKGWSRVTPASQRPPVGRQSEPNRDN